MTFFAAAPFAIFATVESARRPQSAAQSGGTGVGVFSPTSVCDVENRMVVVNPASQVNPQPIVSYAYAPDNKRVARRSAAVDEVVFWSVTGQRIATYSLSVTAKPGTLVAVQSLCEYYFGGKLLMNASGFVHADRLGSVGKYLPFGEERPSATPNGTEKFATYFRDSDTGLDYAVNRYESPGEGRFLSPDPYMASGGPKEPGSWNRYAYTVGDPVNFRNPQGLDRIETEFLFDQKLACQSQIDGEGVQTYLGCVALLTGAVQQFQQQSRANFLSQFGECNRTGTVTEEANLDFVAGFYTDAKALSQHTNLPVAWILAWAAQESGGSSGGWGLNSAALQNNNYFGLTRGNNWSPQIPCTSSSARGYACFLGFGDSVSAALYSTRTDPKSGLQWTVATVMGLGLFVDASVTQIFQTIADLGQDPEQSNYGSRIAATVDSVTRVLDCFKKTGIL
jgi:RHS repeat-associated protein